MTIYNVAGASQTTTLTLRCWLAPDHLCLDVVLSLFQVIDLCLKFVFSLFNICKAVVQNHGQRIDPLLQTFLSARACCEFTSVAKFCSSKSNLLLMDSKIFLDLHFHMFLHIRPVSRSTVSSYLFCSVFILLCVSDVFVHFTFEVQTTRHN